MPPEYQLPNGTIVEAPSQAALKLYLQKTPNAGAPRVDLAQITELLESVNKDYSFPKGLLYRMANRESGFKEDIIRGQTRSRTGAIGIMQFMPETAAEYDINPNDPLDSITGAGRYLSGLRTLFKGSLVHAVAAYNWGPANVKNKGLANAPRETVDYVKNVLGVDITQMDDTLYKADTNEEVN